MLLREFWFSLNHVNSIILFYFLYFTFLDPINNNNYFSMLSEWKILVIDMGSRLIKIIQIGTVPLAHNTQQQGILSVGTEYRKCVCLYCSILWNISACTQSRKKSRSRFKRRLLGHKHYFTPSLKRYMEVEQGSCSSWGTQCYTRKYKYGHGWKRTWVHIIFFPIHQWLFVRGKYF